MWNRSLVQKTEITSNGVRGESTTLLPQGKHLTLESFLKKGRLFNK